MALPKLNTPTYELNLPSSGKKIRFRPFLVKEHKVLLTMSEAEDTEVSRIIRELVDVCTFNALDVESLPHFDLEYIFMHLRAKSIGESVDVVVNCNCGNKINTAFNIEDLKVVKVPEHNSRIMLTDDVGIEMSYPTLEEVVDIFGTQKDEKILDLVVSNIKSIFTKDDYWESKNQSKQDLEDFVYSLTKEQFYKIEQFFETAPKVVQTIETDCPKCGQHNINKLTGLQNFFV